jgi:hypothetical protein
MAAKTTPEHSGSTANDVRTLFGPGGYVRMIDYGRGEPADEPVDLTVYAEALAAIGMTVPRSVPRPCEVTGSVVVDLGDGGRALWIDGGGDISGVELAWAIAAALEERVEDAFAAMEEITRRHAAAQRARTEQVFREALAAAGYTPRRVTGFLRRRRADLADRSVLDVLDDENRTREDVLSAVLEVALALSDHPDVLNQFVNDLGAERPGKRDTEARTE